MLAGARAQAYFPVFTLDNVETRLDRQSLLSPAVASVPALGITATLDGEMIVASTVTSFRVRAVGHRDRERMRWRALLVA